MRLYEGRISLQSCTNKCYRQNFIRRITNTMIMDMFGEETPLRTIRSCRPRTLVKRAQALKSESKGIDEFLDKLSQMLPGLQRDGDNVYLGFSEGCSCPIVRIYRLEFPPTWCDCNTGWKELFESILGRPVKVELRKSALQGDDVCEARVTL